MKRIKSISIFLVAVLCLGLFAACAPQTVELDDADVALASAPEGFIQSDVAMTLSEAEVGKTPALITTLSVSAGSDNYSKNDVVLDFSNSSEGYVLIKYTGSSSSKIKVLITGPRGATGPNGEDWRYNYNMTKKGDYETFPLSDGNGKYNIGVYQNTSGSSYISLLTYDLQVSLKDEFAPFLYPNQYVNFSYSSAAVSKAAELVAGKTTVLDKVAAVYDYVITNFTYDYELAKAPPSGYLPNLDSVFASKKGICFDYAAMMTAMLRSQNVPTKLVLGYVGADRLYHAWISVYTSEHGWVSAVEFNGYNWTRMDPTFASSAASSDSAKQSMEKYIGDGSNYTIRYLY